MTYQICFSVQKELFLFVDFLEPGKCFELIDPPGEALRKGERGILKFVKAKRLPPRCFIRLVFSLGEKSVLVIDVYPNSGISVRIEPKRKSKHSSKSADHYLNDTLASSKIAPMGIRIFEPENVLVHFSLTNAKKDWVCRIQVHRSDLIGPA